MKKITIRRRRSPEAVAVAELKKRVRYMLRPRYAIECFYLGLDHDIEKKLVKLARRQTEGSGMMLGIGLRDVRFDGFASEARARAVAKRIKRAKLPGVRVMIRTFRAA